MRRKNMLIYNSLPSYFLMLLKADNGFTQYIEEKGQRKNWYFTVICKDGDIGLITINDLNTGGVIDADEMGGRVENCIFVPPKDYLELIEELEAMRDNPLSVPEAVKELESRDDDWMRGWAKALDLALRLVAQRANPPSQ